MKKLFCLLALTLLVTSCGNNQNTTPSTETKEEDFVYNGGPIVINEFENKDDLMMVRQIIAETNRNSRVDIDVTNNKEFVKTGNGSLRVSYIAGDHGDIFQRINMTPKLKNITMEDLKEFTCYVYNDNNDSKIANISVYKEEHEVLLQNEVTLLPKTWTFCKVELNKVVLTNFFDRIQGFAIGLPKNNGSTDTYYIDDFTIDFGVAETEEDKYYSNIINDLNERIEKLPEDFALDNTKVINEIENILDIYGTVPVVYRGSLKNYSKIKSLLEYYVNSRAVIDKNKNNTRVLNFDTCFGLAQASEDYTSHELDFSYSKDYRYGFEKGSLAVSCTGKATASGWNSFNITPAFDWSKYETITFAIYADIEHDFGFCITWNKFPVGSQGLNVQPAKKWVSYTYPAEKFSKGGEQINMTELLYDNASSLKGTIYFSAFLGRKPTYDYIDFQLEKFPAIETITLDDEPAINEVRNYYIDLSYAEKAKVSKASLEKLELYEDKIKELKGSTVLPILPELINAIPVKEHYNEAEFSLIYRAFNAYNSLAKVDQEKLDLTLKNKLLTAVENFSKDYPNRNIALFADKDNISYEQTWDTSMNNLQVGITEGYGETYSFEKIDLLDGAYTGALEIKLSNIDLTGLSKIKFWIKMTWDALDPSEAGCLWCSNVNWGNERIDHGAYGTIYSDSWYEITLDVSEMNKSGVLFVQFVLEHNASITMSSIEGILK